MKQEHGALTVSTDEDAGEYDLHLVWAGKQLALRRSDVTRLLKLGGKDGKLDKKDPAFLEDLAARLKAAL